MHFHFWIRHVGFPLAVGGMIYVLHASWPDAIPQWIRWYVPDAIWAFALMSALGLIWHARGRKLSAFWVTCALFAGPVFEFLQWQTLLPGHADPADILVYCAGGLCALYRHRRSRHATVHRPSGIISHLVAACTLTVFVISALATSYGYHEDFVRIRMKFEFGDEALVMHNLNRFALLDWHVTLDDARLFTYTASGTRVPGLSSDTLFYDSLFTTHPQFPLTVDSLTLVKVSCRITGTKMGYYSEPLN